MTAINYTRLAEVPRLSRGLHESIAEGACLMEAVAYVAGEPWSDHPGCVCPTIASFLRRWNDHLQQPDLDRLLRPLVLRVIGTTGGPALAMRRSFMAVDWLVRDAAPTWLALAGLHDHAEMLRELREITALSSTVAPAALAAAASRAARASGYRSATTVGAAITVANRAAVYAAVSVIPLSAHDGIANDAAACVVPCAINAGCDLRPTVVTLQASAVALIERMIVEPEPVQ